MIDHTLQKNEPTRWSVGFIFLESMVLQYNTGRHCVFYYRHHVVWITKYHFKVLRGELQHRVREIIRQVCRENDVEIISGFVAKDDVLMSVPPKLALSDFAFGLAKTIRTTKQNTYCGRRCSERSIVGSASLGGMS